MDDLRQLLEAANKDGLSSRRIASLAAERGFKVGHATVANYLAGKVPKSPSDDVLRALQSVFKIPLAKLQEAAGLSAAVTPIELPPEASRLTPRQWIAVREVIMSMVNPGEVTVEAPVATVTAIAPAPKVTGETRKAARWGTANLPKE